MPESCGECYDKYNICTSNLRDYDDYVNVPPPDCPLEEIPTPHGRLIDADELFCKIDGIKGWDYGDESDMAISAAEALSAIDDSPTVIEAEVSEE